MDDLQLRLNEFLRKQRKAPKIGVRMMMLGVYSGFCLQRLPPEACVHLRKTRPARYLKWGMTPHNLGNHRIYFGNHPTVTKQVLIQ